MRSPELGLRKPLNHAIDGAPLSGGVNGGLALLGISAVASPKNTLSATSGWTVAQVADASGASTGFRRFPRLRTDWARSSSAQPLRSQSLLRTLVAGQFLLTVVPQLVCGGVNDSDQLT